MISAGRIQFIDNVDNYDSISYVIDQSKVNCDIKKDNDKVTIILMKKKESEKALF